MCEMERTDGSVGSSQHSVRQQTLLTVYQPCFRSVWTSYFSMSRKHFLYWFGKLNLQFYWSRKTNGSFQMGLPTPALVFSVLRWNAIRIYHHPLKSLTVRKNKTHSLFSLLLISNGYCIPDSSQAELNLPFINTRRGADSVDNCVWMILLIILILSKLDSKSLKHSW